MKIGFVLDDTLDTHDGVQQYVRMLGGWCASFGHEVHYLTGETKRNDIANVHSMTKNLKVSFNQNSLSVPLPTSRARIKAFLKAQKFDVLHVQLPSSPFFGSRVVLAAPNNTALIGTFHIAPASRMVTAATKLLSAWDARSLQKFTSLVSVSAEAQRFLKHTFKADSVIVPNMIDHGAWRAHTTTQYDEDIVFVGRLVARKGCTHLLQAFKLLVRDNSGLKLKIVGDGAQRKKLEQFVHVNNLSELVTFCGRVSEEEKRRVLSRAKVAVFPATGGESFGIVLLEAMAAGSRVVLGGNNPGYRTVMGTVDGALFDPAHHQEFAARLQQMLTDKTVANSIHAQQQELIKSYDINVVAPKLLSIYNAAIAKTRQN